MGTPSEADLSVSRLWKVNRTIHELVRDRVRLLSLSAFLWSCFFFLVVRFYEWPLDGRALRVVTKPNCFIISFHVIYNFIKFIPLSTELLNFTEPFFRSYIQGYAVADDEISMSLDQFKNMYGRSGTVDRASLGFFTHLRSDPTQSIYIYFCDERNVGVKNMRKWVDFFKRVQCSNGLLGCWIFWMKKGFEEELSSSQLQWPHRQERLVLGIRIFDCLNG